MAFIFNLFIIGLPSIVIAIIGVRSFLNSGSWQVMWLGIGTLIFGLAVIFGSFLLDRTSVNAAITVHNSISFFSSVLFFFGAFFIVNKIHNKEIDGRLSAVLQVYMISFAVVIFIIFSSVQGLLPPFFIDNVGGTSIRQIIVGLSVLLFFVSGVMILKEYNKEKSLLLYWYALGLILLSMGMLGILFQSETGTPLNWMGRISQLLGGLYLAVAALIIFKTAKSRNIPTDEALSSFFSTGTSNITELLKNVTDAVITTDLNFRITGWNPAAEKIYGWKQEEALGNHMMDFLKTTYNPTPISDEKILKDSWTGEVVQKHKNGKNINVVTSISHLKDEYDNLTGAIAINHDITIRKKAEKSLKDSKDILKLKVEERTAELNNERKRLFDVLETVPIMICLLSDDYHVTFANKSFRDKFGESEGRHCYEYCFGYEEPCDFCESYKVLETGKPHQWEVTTPDGGVIEAYDFPFNDAYGKSMILEMDVDVTEQREAHKTLKNLNKVLEKRVEERTESLQKTQDNLQELVNNLEISNRELEQFAYVASHDLQEPLRMISSFTQLLERRYKNQLDDDADEFIGYVVEGAQRMKYLIDDLLAFSRITSEAEHFELFNLETALNVVLSYLNPLIEQNNTIITHEPLPSIKGDYSQIQQLLQNLISNAIKFHDEQPTKIHISSKKSDKEWIIGVSDNGIGIDPKYQEQIFDIFNRLHTREEYPGTGIGLAICKKIVERHGGRIWVESDTNKGSTFYFTIPIEY